MSCYTPELALLLLLIESLRALWNDGNVSLTEVELSRRIKSLSGGDV